MRWLRLVLRLQAIYYVVTGVWPLLSMRTFEMVTGPKTDDWLVRMVALATVSVGLTLWVGARPPRPGGAIVLLGATIAASFAAIDLIYALGGRISGIYLLDAAGEIVLLVAVVALYLYGRGRA